MNMDVCIQTEKIKTVEHLKDKDEDSLNTILNNNG